MTNDANNIELVCPTCGHENSIQFDKSFVDQTIACKACNTSIYWHNCPKCETGWCDSQSSVAKCPGCGER